MHSHQLITGKIKRSSKHLERCANWLTDWRQFSLDSFSWWTICWRPVKEFDSGEATSGFSRPHNRTSRNSKASDACSLKIRALVYSILHRTSVNFIRG